MDMSNLVMHSQVPNEIINQIANNEFFDLQEMFSGTPDKPTKLSTVKWTCRIHGQRMVKELSKN